jgi:dihydroorotase
LEAEAGSSYSVDADTQPNLVPPLTSTDAVLAYKADLEVIDPHTEFLMTLYLHPDVTPQEIKKAAKAGVKGTFLFT